ncbi:hypothetical protein [Mucilaginibacter limnophilus]|uniref:hypothetical protein n=1 Tax=Mucilaginibacter limnophilus TaxID=1932778 RepID=UPI00197C89EA|nr:hypothetical protein [Mucilaginibacter limnophilus]
MKKLILTTAIALSVFTVQKVSAQISVNINIGSQPAWGPVGYDYVNYYYLPDVDAYYDVPNRRYVYLDNNVWVHRTYLPARYSNYNVYNGYKVVINDPEPWRNHTVIHNKYVVYKGKPSQPIIRNSHDVKYTKYRTSKKTVTHVKVDNDKGRKNFTKVKVKSHGHGNGRGKGHDKH